MWNQMTFNNTDRKQNLEIWMKCIIIVPLLITGIAMIKRYDETKAW